MNINHINPYNGDNTLILAIKQNCHIQLIEFLLPYIHINHLNKNKYNALSISLKCYQKLKLIKLLVQHGIDVNVVNQDGYSIIILAVDYGCKELIILYLLKQGVDINQLDSTHHHLLYHLIEKHYINCINYLLSTQNLNQDILNHAVMQSMIYNKFDITQLLMQHVNINGKYNHLYCDTLLKICIYLHEYTFVEFLILHGVDVNLKTNDVSPLFYAIQQSQRCYQDDIIYLLLRNQANVNEIVNHQTLLMYCIEKHISSSIIDLLIDFGVDIHYTINQTSALTDALCDVHDIHIVLKLLKLGVDYKLISPHQWTNYYNHVHQCYYQQSQKLLKILKNNYHNQPSLQTL
jgi:ankyrin repeat protein